MGLKPLVILEAEKLTPAEKAWLQSQGFDTRTRLEKRQTMPVFSPVSHWMDREFETARKI